MDLRKGDFFTLRFSLNLAEDVDRCLQPLLVSEDPLEVSGAKEGIGTVLVFVLPRHEKESDFPDCVNVSHFPKVRSQGCPCQTFILSILSFCAQEQQKVIWMSQAAG